MINTIKKAVERITWRMSNGWKSNDTDIEAINFIVDFVNITSKDNLKQNELFAKLYIWSYSQFLKKHNATVFDPIPQKELNKMLSKPIEIFIEAFRQDLNTTEQYQSFVKNGIPITNPQLMTDEEREKIEIITDVWDYDTIKENLERDINNCLIIHAKKD